MSDAVMRLAAAALCGLLAGCGLKGPLYLPEEAKDVVTRPSQTPATPPEGAPEAPAPEPDKDEQQDGTPPPR